MQNLEAFRGRAELNLKVYLSMATESAIGVSNSCDLAWLGLKGKHFRCIREQQGLQVRMICRDAM